MISGGRKIKIVRGNQILGEIEGLMELVSDDQMMLNRRETEYSFFNCAGSVTGCVHG
jgi:hypothetical protein